MPDSMGDREYRQDRPKHSFDEFPKSFGENGIRQQFIYHCNSDFLPHAAHFGVAAIRFFDCWALHGLGVEGVAL